MTTEYLPEEAFQDLLRCLMPENALVLRLMTETGLRISDAVSMPKLEVGGTEVNGGLWRYSCIERKTQKKRIVYIAPDLAQDMIRYGRLTKDSPYQFPGRDIQKHRTRQAVWKDLNRTAALWRVDGKKLRRNLGTHSARKIYAVNLRKRLEAQGEENPVLGVMMDMNHRDLAVTFLYAMADIITERRKRKLG